MSKYRNKFKIGDIVVSNWDYAWLPRGSRWKVCGITSTGSIKLMGVQGSYIPEQFLHASKFDEEREEELNSTEEVNNGFIIIDEDGYPRGQVYYAVEDSFDFLRDLNQYGTEARLFQIGREICNPNFGQVDLFLITGIEKDNGYKFYAKRNHIDAPQYAARFVGYDGLGEYATEIEGFRLYTKVQADEFTLEEAKQILGHYNAKNFNGWAKGLTLELVDSGK